MRLQRDESCSYHATNGFEATSKLNVSIKDSRRQRKRVEGRPGGVIEREYGRGRDKDARKTCMYNGAGNLEFGQ